MALRINSWSFSSLLSYEACPYRFYLKLSGAEVPEREPIRGEVVHEEAERYVRGELDALPRSLRKFAEQFEKDRELYAAGKLVLEEPWGFDRELKPCDWNAPEVWLRMKLDQFIRIDDHAAKVVDLKTGKSMGNEIKHVQQGQLYMIGSFMRYPELEVVETEFRYLDEGKSKKRSYTRKNMLALLPRWLERAKRMTDDTVFKAKPNRINCRFCEYGINKGSKACHYAVPWE